MENLELLSFNELREKISEMEEVLKILNSDADIRTKNYLLIERILSKNNIEIERKYDSETDVLELKINCLDIKMRKNVYIDNYIKIKNTEMVILIHIHDTLKGMINISRIKARGYALDIDKCKRDNFIKTYHIIKRIICPNHCEIASNIAIYILDDIFGIGTDIFFTKPNASYRFVMLSNNYCCLKYHVNKSPYTLIEDIPYSFLKFILKKAVFKKRTILSRVLYNEINVDYFNTNGIRTVIDDGENIELYTTYGKLLAKIILDDSEYSKVAVLFYDFIPRSWEFLDAISFYAHMVEIKYNKYLKDIE